MARIWRITNKHNNKIIEDFICDNEWELHRIKSAEALTLLQVAKFIYDMVLKVRLGSIVIYCNNLKVA